MTGYQQKLLHTRIKTRLLISTLKSLKMNMEMGALLTFSLSMMVTEVILIGGTFSVYC